MLTWSDKSLGLLLSSFLHFLDWPFHFPSSFNPATPSSFIFLRLEKYEKGSQTISGAPLLSCDAPLKDHRRPRAANRGSYQMAHGDGTMGNRSSRKHVRARFAGAVTTCGSSHESWLRARRPVVPKRRGEKKGEFNTQRKSREFDGGCKRRLERRMRGRLNTRVKHGRALQPSLHHLIIFPVYIHKATLCLFSLSLSHGLTFLTTWSLQTFLDCKRQNCGWFIARDISESVQKKRRNQTTKRESWEVREAIKHEREMKNRHTRRGQRRYL